MHTCAGKPATVRAARVWDAWVRGKLRLQSGHTGDTPEEKLGEQEPKDVCVKEEGMSCCHSEEPECDEA